MSKRAHLEETLGILEAELVLAVKTELSKIARGGESKFISRHLGSYTAKEYSDRHTDILERLEKDVRKLRAKLGVGETNFPIDCLREFVSRHKYGHSVKHIARDLVARMKSADQVYNIRMEGDREKRGASS